MTVEETPTSKENRWKIHGQNPLKLSEREALTARLLSGSVAREHTNAIQQLVHDDRAQYPLFLRTVLEELRRVDAAAFPSRLDALLALQTPEALFDDVLAGLEQQHDRALVQGIVCAVAASRGGYSRDELLSVLQVEPSLFDPVLQALSPHLLQFGGKFTILHAQLRSAASTRYFNGESSGVHACLAKKLQTLPVDHSLRLEEPWQWKRSGDRDALFASLEDRDLFTRLMEFENQGDLLTYWAMLDDLRPKFIAVGNRRIGRVRGKITEAQLRQLVTFVRFCILVTKYSSLEKVISRLLDAAKVSGLKGSVQWWWLRLSLVDLYNLTGAHDRSQLLMEELFELTGSESNHISMRIEALQRIATILTNAYRFEEAEKIILEEIELESAAYGPTDVRRALGYLNLGSISYYTGRQNQAAGLFERADEFWQRGRQHDPRRADVLNNLALTRHPGDPNGSVDLLSQAIALVRAAYGETTHYVVPFLINRAKYLGDAKSDKATASLDEAMALAEAMGDEPCMSTILAYYGSFAKTNNDHETARRYLLKAYEIRDRLYGSDHGLTLDIVKKLKALPPNSDSDT